MTSDPLSDILLLLKPVSYLSAGFDAAGDWSVAFPDQGGKIKCGALVRGRCQLAVEGAGPPVMLEAGDCFVLPTGRAFAMASEPDLPPVPAKALFPPARHGGVVTVNGGGEVFMASSRFALAGGHAALIGSLMPPLIHVESGPGQEMLRFSIERMVAEFAGQRPGSVLVIRHLAHLVLVEALRAHLASSPPGGTGWMAALGDARIGAALRAVHADPGRRWTLVALAAEAGMSRSSFAERFRAIVGLPPMDYLARWRMALAADRLAEGREGVGVIALSLGYESESAFSTAFRRVMGAAPRRYGRGEDMTAPPLAAE
ncbi:AraC family transcriptional regulator [Kaistia geumhonensis]|uniref:AraC-like DNA-binding protein n=1 Tax=Kaistia geumhonensis TaxID=410839 RepID=A0ABU0M6X7_9HYPH|nr:AraC family transcriptional regulator [Kaistia geumhonensis]MCX5478093.1 AraC family transcriptional regulator [Kaistia geumhonensis]MDQ0516691.1 AraC-like DNA-binding protein [Kaistia geumhonensis]